MDDDLYRKIEEWEKQQDLPLRQLLGGLMPLINEHGPRSEPVRQYIIAQRGAEHYERFENLALVLIVLAEQYGQDKLGELFKSCQKADEWDHAPYLPDEIKGLEGYFPDPLSDNSTL